MLAAKRSASSCHRGTMRCDLPTAQAAALFCKQGTRMLSRYKTGLQGHNTEADLETRQSRFHFDLPCQRHHLYHTAAVRQSDTKL